MFFCVLYDISSQKTLRRIAQLCEKAGLQRIQKSVFLGKLSQTQSNEFREACLRWLDPQTDKLLVLPLSKASLSRRIELGAIFPIQELLERPSVMFV